ncbi:hypothetical protein [Nocardioides sp.]|uniref:HD domain-containing protein n=1 Tax=Nocardioides sp. TaxID=35761 RepID=UPI0039E6D54A
MELPQHWPLPDAQPGSAELRDELIAAYAGPERRYHDTRHLADVLRRLGELREAGAVFEQLPVTLAAWFHDSVYDGERDAEERSAMWAETALTGLVDAATVTEVTRLVRLTETHQPESEDRNGAALCDADLAILAADADRYGDYRAAVRQEYADLSADDFREGRTQVLRRLIEREHLFTTAFARASWEGVARANIAGELAALEGR